MNLRILLAFGVLVSSLALPGCYSVYGRPYYGHHAEYGWRR